MTAAGARPGLPAGPCALALLAGCLLAAGCAVGSRAPRPELPPARAPEPGAPGKAPEAAPGSLLQWPVRPVEILSRYGAARRGYRHTGLDLRGRHGDPVMAAGPGTVIYAGTMRGYGKTVILAHGSGLETLYAHNSAILVTPGERVAAGQAIARVGRTGNATTEHCHFEVRRNGVELDPESYLGPP